VVGMWLWGAGRTGRPAYWIALVALIALSLGSHWLARPLLDGGASVLVIGPLVLATQVLVVWISICLLSRRLHDAGHSAWLQLPPTLTVIAGLGLLEPAWAEALNLSERVMTVVGWGVPVVYFGLFVAVGLPRSTGPNRFDRPADARASIVAAFDDQVPGGEV